MAGDSALRLLMQPTQMDRFLALAGTASLMIVRNDSIHQSTDLEAQSQWFGVTETDSAIDSKTIESPAHMATGGAQKQGHRGDLKNKIEVQSGFGESAIRVTTQDVSL